MSPAQYPLSILENRNRTTKVIPIIHLLHSRNPVQRHHIRTRFGTQPPKINITATVFHADHIFLTAFSSEAVLGIIIEERVETCAIDKDVGRGDDAEAP